MNITSLIFWAVFVLPLIVFLVWLIRQDKRNSKKGLIVLAIIVVGGIVYMYWKTSILYSHDPALEKFLGL